MDSIRNCLVRLADLTLCLSILALYAIFFYGLVGHAILTLRTISRAAYRIQEFYCYVILYQSMETLAAEAQASLKSTAPIEDKLKYLTELKQEIKHRSCPERSVPTIFSVVRVALTTPHAFDAGFSILGHLTKRLLLQKLHSSVYSQTLKLLPVFLERLGDQRDRVRLRATAALSDFYAVSDEARKDVELFVRDTVLVSRNPRAKQSAMQWILETHKEKNMLFRSFVPNIVNCLEDADGNVRSTAQSTVIELFRDTPTKSKHDLLKKMSDRGVRKGIETHILVELGMESGSQKLSGIDQTPTPVSTQKKESRSQSLHQSQPLPNETPPDTQPMSIAEQEAASLTPLYVESSRDLEETFSEMSQWFEGKEAESNWLKREKSIEKLRRITKGNAPQEYASPFMAHIKKMLDSILKAVNSLRTTVCTIGCHLIQDLARVCGHAMDGSMIDTLLPNLIKLCGNTKKIAAAKANDTVNAIMANTTYHIRLLHNIQYASQDKNVQPRTFSCGWLKTVLNRHSHSKHAIEHSGGLDIIEKVIKTGLNDSNPSVRESMRAAYWAFAKTWSDKADHIMSGLSQTHQDLMLKHAANPDPHRSFTSTTTAAPSAKAMLSKSTSAASSRPSIKETIAAQKKAKAAGRNLPERPESAAEISHSPTKSAAPARPATAMSSRAVSTQSVGTLSSAPVRPRRKVEPTRPAPSEQAASSLPPEDLLRPTTPGTHGSPNSSPTRHPKDAVIQSGSPRNAIPLRQSPQRRGYEEPTKRQGISPSKLDRVSPTRQNLVMDEEQLTQIIPKFTANQLPPSLGNYLPHDQLETNGKASPEKQSFLNGYHQGSSPSPRKKHTDLENGVQLASESPASQRGSPQRISMSPRNIAGRKENLQQRHMYAQDSKGLKVYEDPEDEGSSTTQPTSHVSPTRALGELPVNEPLNRNRNAVEDDFKLVREEHVGPRKEEYHSDWKSEMQRQSKKLARDGEKWDNPLQTQKMLQSGITRIQAKSLDVHGFRKLQSIIAFAPKTIWEDGYKIQELIMPLLEFLEETKFADVNDGVKDLDVKTQILVTIKLLHCNYHEWLEPFYLQIVCACITARKYYHPTTHMVAGLEETIEELLRFCQPLEVITAVLDLLEMDTDHLTKNVSCYVLGGQLHKCHRASLQPPVQRIGELASQCLQSSNPDVRRAAVEMSLEMYYNVPEEKFWSLLSGVREDYKGLVSYYLARHQSVHDV